MNDIYQKGLNFFMKELNIMEATVYTSPNPLTLICSLNEDGTTNLAPFQKKGTGMSAPSPDPERAKIPSPTTELSCWTKVFLFLL